MVPHVEPGEKAKDEGDESVDRELCMKRERGGKGETRKRHTQRLATNKIHLKRVHRARRPVRGFRPLMPPLSSSSLRPGIRDSPLLKASTPPPSLGRPKVDSTLFLRWRRLPPSRASENL